MFSILKNKVRGLFRSKKIRNSYLPSDVLDIQYAVEVLNSLARKEPDGIESYIALASLYRVRGEFEKALQIHSSLLVRRDIAHTLKARLYAELGKDYQQAGIFDRALASYKQAQDFGYNNDALQYEVIAVYDMLGEYEQASSVARRIKDSLYEGYYLMKQQMHHSAIIPLTKHSILNILSISSDLVQGWLLLLCYYSVPEHMDKFRSSFIQALNSISIRFLLFEFYFQSNTYQNSSDEDKKLIVDTIAGLLKDYKEDFLILYYLGIFYRSIGDTYHAIEAFERSLSLQEDFWGTQYELFSLAVRSFREDDLVRKPTDFFLGVCKQIKRFVCYSCQFETNTAFSLCPHCKRIQTITFKTLL